MLVHCNTITILPSKGCIYLYCATLMDSFIIDVTIPWGCWNCSQMDWDLRDHYSCTPLSPSWRTEM